MKVKDCMSKEVLTVKRSTTLGQLMQTFQKYHLHSFPVVEENNHLLGIVNFEDILKVFQPYSTELSTMLQAVPFMEMESQQEDFLAADISEEMGILVVVDDLMSKNFVTVGPEMHINEARAQMKLHSIDRLCVVKEGRLVGMVSLFDIVLAVFREKGVIK